ncbi:hypothetical protein ABZT49_00870 [Methylobacterium sp. EM32]|uniref:hypothetical protein n=1 Tax=Methylobacterium sp. EM32 TaxID=3163481 RepID=UPI0033B55434
MSDGFREFISRNSVASSSSMPLVHTTASYFVKSIRESDALIPQICDVFGTPLTYFFVGRPAYRVKHAEGQAEDWELPSCFIFRYEAMVNPKRVFPFDSGAFSTGRMPNYVGMMDRDSFDVANIEDAPQRVIGAFFGSLSKYFEGKPKDAGQFANEFSLGVFDQEAKAVHRLASEKSLSTLDDRRLSVEMQFDTLVDLKVENPLAVIMPLPYYADAKFRDHVENVWKATPISYPISSLNSCEYQALIYDRMMTFYQKIGVL